MKKGLSAISAVALVASMFSSVAFAAEAPKTAQEKFDALKAAGIFEGINDKGDAGLDQSMTREQVAKILVKLMGLKEDAAGAAVYKDVDASGWAVGYIGAATKAGLMDGVAEGAFAPTATFTAEQLAAVLDRALGLAKSTDEVKGTVSEWAKGYVAAAVKAGLLDANTTDYTKPALREVLVNGAFSAYTQVQAKNQSATFAVVGAKKFEVKFAAPVADTAKAVISVKNGTNAVNYKSVTFSDDKKTATVEFPYAVAAAEYTVSVTGVTEKEMSGKVTVEAEKVASIEFSSDKAVLARGDATQVSVAYKVFNQYKEEITSNSSLTATTSVGTIGGGNTVSGGNITINNANSFKAGDVIAVSLLNTNGTFKSATLTVAPQASVSAVAITSLYQDNTTKSELQAGNTNAAEYALVLDAKDQYGNSVTTSAYLQSDLIVTVSNTAVANVNGYNAAANTATFGILKIDGNDKAVLKLNGALTAGTSTVNLISKSTGAKASFDVVVKDATKVDAFTMSAPALAVAAEDTVIPFTAVDQFGKAVDHPTTGSFTSINATSGTVVFEKDVVANKTNMKLRNPAKGTVIITAITPTNKVVQLTVNVVDAKVPNVVSAVKDFETSVLKDGTVSISKDNVVVKDQYGRDMTPNWGDGVAVTNDEYRLVVETSDSSKVSVSSNVYVNDTGVVTLTGAAKGASAITLKLEKATSSAAFAQVANSAFSYTQNVVENADIASYEATVSGTVYDNGALATYGKALTVKGVLANGTKVTVPNTEVNYSVISSDEDVVFDRAAGKVYATGLTYNGTETSADKIVTVVVKGATTQTIPVTVKVSKDIPAIQTLSLKDTGTVNTAVKKESDTVISANAADVNTDAKLKAAIEDIVKSVDQYGVEISESFPTVIASNFSMAHATKDLAHLATGDSFNVTAIVGSKFVSLKVIVK